MSFWKTEDGWQHLDGYIIIKGAIVHYTQQICFSGARSYVKAVEIGGGAGSDSSMTNIMAIKY